MLLESFVNDFFGTLVFSSLLNVDVENRVIATQGREMNENQDSKAVPSLWLFRIGDMMWISVITEPHLKM